ncbi:MAG TPA: acetylglutamate kinase, partial [Cyclobacteriaceae bacterium]|nr:acetylglutamate kinase [Cyclobacteriaceae bacterium]
FIIKIGGNVLDKPEALSEFLNDFASIRSPKILVHGGGKIATKLGEQLGIESKYINGRRITDAATVDVVTMVYGGLVNKKIVAKLQQVNCNALGLTGADGAVIKAVKRPVKDIDYGFVGDICAGDINVLFLVTLLSAGIVPVFAPLTYSEGQILNTNADTIASTLAVALSKEYNVRLIYCFEKKGVLMNVNNEHSVVTHMTEEKYKELLARNVLADGILPKLENAFASIREGVKEVLIGDANDLITNTGEQTAGTLITL